MDEGDRGASRPIRVLHAEDDVSFRDLVAELLDAETDVDVVSASTPAEALDRLRESRFDCVLSDYDADEAAAFLPVIEATEGGPPCVVLTGKDREQIDAAASAAVDDYVRKGASDQFGTLVERIRNHVDRYWSAERHRALFEEGAGPMVVHDAETGEIIDVNSQYAEMLGYDREQAAAMDISDIAPGDEPYTPERARERLTAAAAGEPQTFEWQNVDTNGQRVPVEVTLKRMDVAGAGRVLATIRDISDRKRREAALERHKGHLEQLHTAATRLLGAETRAEVHEGVLAAAESVLDPQFCAVVIRDGNQLTPVAVGGRDPDAPSEPLPLTESPEWAAIETGETQGYATESGQMLCVPLEDHGVLCFRGYAPTEGHARELAETLASHAAVALDRAEREQQLRERSRRRESLAAAFPDYVFFLDADGEYQEVWLAAQHEARGGSAEEELLGLTVGDRLSETATATVLDAIDEALATGEVQEIEYRVEERSRTSWFEARAAPLPDDGEGDPEVVLVARDVTTQRQYERRLEAQNERLDEFASMVSHDLRNPLNVVQGRLELIESFADSEQVLDHATAADAAADRMNDLIEDMLTVARTNERTLTLGPVAIQHAASRAWSAISEPDASLTVSEEVRVRADESDLIRLFENLFRNAVEHSSTGSQPESDDVGEQRSTASLTESGDADEHGSTGNRKPAASGDVVEHAGPDVSVRVEALPDGFAVADDGPGIDEPHRDRVFESGYSTADGGTGYGLDIVKRIATAHGWSVSLAACSEGARFEVTGVEFVDDESAAEGSETDRTA